MMWTLVDDFGLFILTENRWHFNTNIILKTQANAINLRNITLNRCPLVLQRFANDTSIDRFNKLSFYRMFLDIAISLKYRW